MPEYVADAHTLLWYLLNSPRLGANASATFTAADQGQARIVIPSIVLAELYYANVKLKRPLDFKKALAQLQSAHQFVFVDFRASDTLLFDQLAAIPENARPHHRRRGPDPELPAADPRCFHNRQ